MSKVRVRRKHQVTIPANIARMAGIKPGDLLEVAYAHGVVTLTAAGRNVRASSLQEFAGIAHGAWGRSVAEVEAQLAGDRASWDR